MTKSCQIMKGIDKVYIDSFNIYGLQKSCKEDRLSINSSLQIRKQGFRKVK